MKSIQLFLVAVMCLTLASCGEHWGGGLIIIPILTGLGALIFGYKTFVSSNSGSTQQTPYGTKEGGNVVNKGYLIFTAILTIATIIIIIMINGDK
jgi:hypothetical protein